MTKKQILLCRHGETEFGHGKVCAGGTDVLLSPVGIEMSLANIREIVRARTQVVITSSQKRARLPAIHLQKRCGVPHIADPDLRERDLGIFECITWEGLRNHQPDHFKKFFDDPLGYHIPESEHPQEFKNRVLDAWERILAMQEERIAVIGHALTNAVILGSIDSTIRWDQNQHIGCMNRIMVHTDGPRIEEANVVLYDAFEKAIKG